MKKQFDESKHRRDELGRFAEMSAKEISNTIKQEIGEHKYIVSKNGRVPYDALTRRQWGVWYDEQSKREKYYLLGEYGERRFVYIDDVFILTDGTYEHPTVEAVYEFGNPDKTLRLKGVLEKHYGRV